MIEEEQTQTTLRRLIFYLLLGIFSVGVLYRLVLGAKGLKVTSWWRTPWHNFAVGGVAFSWHQIGWAYDVLPKNSATLHRLDQLRLKVIPESDHLHAQVDLPTLLRLLIVIPGPP